MSYCSQLDKNGQPFSLPFILLVFINVIDAKRDDEVRLRYYIARNAATDGLPPSSTITLLRGERDV
jgi:hypothetical protein